MRRCTEFYKIRRLNKEEIDTINSLAFEYIEENKEQHSYMLFSCIQAERVEGSVNDMFAHIRPYLEPVTPYTLRLDSERFKRDHSLPMPSIWYDSSSKGDTIELYFMTDEGNMRTIPLTLDEYRGYLLKEPSTYLALYAETIPFSVPKFNRTSLEKHLPGDLHKHAFFKLSDEAIEELVKSECISSEELTCEEGEAIFYRDYFTYGG